MRLKAVALYLQAQNAGSFDTDIFVTEMPASCLNGILLMNSYSGSRIDHELPGRRETGFRLIVRGQEYEATEARARAVSKLLTIFQDVVMTEGVSVPGIKMKQCLPMTEPLPYRRSEYGVWEFEVDVECVYIER